MLTMLKDKHALKHIEEMKAKLSDKPVPALLKAMLAVDPNPNSNPNPNPNPIPSH